MKKKVFIKPFALLLAVIALMFTLTSCGLTTNPPEEGAFSLVMDFAQTTVKIGEKVTYKAILKNAEHESYTLKHPGELVNIYVVKAEDYKDADTHLLTDATISESDIAPHGQAEGFVDFRPTEAGEYILKAYTVFTIEGKDYNKNYSFESDEIKITVTE